MRLNSIKTTNTQRRCLFISGSNQKVEKLQDGRLCRTTSRKAPLGAYSPHFTSDRSILRHAIVYPVPARSVKSLYCRFRINPLWKRKVQHEHVYQLSLSSGGSRLTSKSPARAIEWDVGPQRKGLSVWSRFTSRSTSSRPGPYGSESIAATINSADSRLDGTPVLYRRSYSCFHQDSSGQQWMAPGARLNRPPHRLYSSRIQSRWKSKHDEAFFCPAWRESGCRNPDRSSVVTRYFP